jgi:hypothetical protein
VTGSTFVTWEYLTIPERERDRLATLGQEGWELAAVGGSRDEPLLYLKRPGQDLRERVTIEQRNRYYESQGLDPLRPEERGLA